MPSVRPLQRDSGQRCDMCSALSLSFPFCCCKKYISHAFQRVLGSSPTGPFSSRSTTRSKGEKAKGQEHHPHQQHKCGPWRKTRLKRKGCPQPGLQTQTRGRRRTCARSPPHTCTRVASLRRSRTRSRSRQAVASPRGAARGRQHLPLADRPWNGRLALQARGLLAPRGRPAVVRGPARPPAGQRRIAFVFRCARPSRYYQSAWPHRVCGCALCLGQFCAGEVCALPVV